jgi:predicted ATPase
VPPLASLLSLPLGERYLPLTLTPQQQKQKTLEALLAVLMALTAQQPVLFILEDIHWLDPSSLEFLSLLADQAATMHLFTLLTCRPTFRPPWAPDAHLTHLTLSRLPRHQAALMIAKVAGGKTLPAEVRQQLLTRTDGVPLFVEELTKMVLESGFISEADERYELTGPLPTLAIPVTLHDSLIARLDRLNTAKTVAQLGAAIGRQFSYELLRAIWPMDEATLQQALGQLVETEMLYQRGLSVPAQEYAAAVSSTDRPDTGRAVSRDRGDPARTAGPSLHRRGASGAGRVLLAAGWSARHRALSQRRGD